MKFDKTMLAILFVIFAVWARKSIIFPDTFGGLATDLKPKKAVPSPGAGKSEDRG